MLDIYAKEFVAIGDFYTTKGKRKGDYVLVPKKELEEMLDKNRYDTAMNKLKIWKHLGWIDADKDRRYTKRVYSQETRKYITSVKMSCEKLDLLRELIKPFKVASTNTKEGQFE